MQGVIVAIITTAVLGAYGVFLKDQLMAGNWWIVPLGLAITFAVIYWMSPEDRPSYHRFFSRLSLRK